LVFGTPAASLRRVSNEPMTKPTAEETTMNRTSILTLAATALLVATSAHAASPRDEIQAPRGQEIQAPRGQEIQAPRGQEIQAPRV
jgi:hypothetical protein